MIGFENPGFYGSSSGVVMDNKFIKLGIVTRLVDQFTFSAHFQWIINGGNYENQIAFDFDVLPATDGYYRQDIAYVNASNQIIYLQGVEDLETYLPTLLPADCLLLATWSIYGDVISDPVIVDLGEQFVKKSYSGELIANASPEYLRLNNADGKMSFVFQNSLGIFDFKGFIQFEDNADLYDGKIVTLKNENIYPVNLANQSGVNNIKFNFSSGTDYLLMPNEILVLRYSITRGLENLSSNLPSKYIEVTKSELDDLVNTSKLLPSAYYKVTGVDANLYGGTTIYIQALTTNTLTKGAIGQFFNAKYDIATTGFGIWSDLMYCNMVSIVGVFQINESVTSNNGATGIFLAYGVIKFLSGDWSVSVDITGDNSLATADINGQSTPSYFPDERKIWGGKYFANLEGNVGNATNDFQLDSAWAEVPFEVNDYNEVFDEIEYDYENDLITYRSDKAGNSVRLNKATLDYFKGLDITLNPIKYFQWGNDYIDSEERGVGNNKIEHGVFNNINFRGLKCLNNTLNQYSYINNGVYSNLSIIEANTFEKEAIFKDFVLGQGASISRNEFHIQSGLLNQYFGNDSFIQRTVFQPLTSINDAIYQIGARFEWSNLDVNASIAKMHLGAGVWLRMLKMNPLANLNLESTGVLNQTITDLELASSVQLFADLSTANLIFATFSKTIVTAQGGTPKLMYVDGTGVLTIANVTD